VRDVVEDTEDPGVLRDFCPMDFIFGEEGIKDLDGDVVDWDFEVDEHFLKLLLFPFCSLDFGQYCGQPLFELAFGEGASFQHQQKLRWVSFYFVPVNFFFEDNAAVISHKIIFDEIIFENLLGKLWGHDVEGDHDFVEVAGTEAAEGGRIVFLLDLVVEVGEFGDGAECDEACAFDDSFKHEAEEYFALV
jgi:hypothetical protein